MAVVVVGGWLVVVVVVVVVHIRQAMRHGVDKLEAALHELQIAVDGVAGDYKMKQTVLLHLPENGESAHFLYLAPTRW
jgi:hypothetical protein